MKYLFILLLISCLGLQVRAFNLSNEAEISILTCSPGNELYSLFGHTAIRVHDPKVNYDNVFNYGTFDFDTPYFYLKYAQGTLLYQLTQRPFRSFMYTYLVEERSVYSQTLKLDSLQKQKLFNLLLENYCPENRSYLYNFLFDNCTTRSRDILLKSLPEEIAWNVTDAQKSYWNLLDEYLKVSPWVQWGIHTILGQPGNRQAPTFHYMFLPDYLMYGLNTASFPNQHSTEDSTKMDKRLAQDVEIVYQAPETKIDTPWYSHPIFVFAFSVILLILLLHYFRNTVLLNTVSMLLFLCTGVLGCLIVFLGGFTSHPITAPNWNILWANPLNLFVFPFLMKKRVSCIIRLYLKFYLAVLIIAIPVWAIAQPAVPLASISLIVLMIYLSIQQRNK